MPDSCLINRYEPGTRLSLHQDRNERDFSQPIVSVSLGLPAVFVLGAQAFWALAVRRDRRRDLMHAVVTDLLRKGVKL